MTQMRRPLATSMPRGLSIFRARPCADPVCRWSFAALPARADDVPRNVARKPTRSLTARRPCAPQLEAKTERERSIKDYQQAVSAYRRVYLITPRAVEDPGAIREVGGPLSHHGRAVRSQVFRFGGRDLRVFAPRIPRVLATAKTRNWPSPRSREIISARQTWRRRATRIF